MWICAWSGEKDENFHLTQKSKKPQNNVENPQNDTFLLNIKLASLRTEHLVVSATKNITYLNSRKILTIKHLDVYIFYIADRTNFLFSKIFLTSLFLSVFATLLFVVQREDCKRIVLLVLPI